MITTIQSVKLADEEQSINIRQEPDDKLLNKILNDYCVFRLGDSIQVSEVKRFHCKVENIKDIFELGNKMKLVVDQIKDYAVENQVIIQGYNIKTYNVFNMNDRHIEINVTFVDVGN